jgi:aldose 1-epimerase
MTQEPHLLENEHWQVGILPETGASVAFGRIKRGDRWVDFMRPTAPTDYGNSSMAASFLLIPWSNRIKDARFQFRGETIQLQPNTPEGFAQHGVVRKVAWKIAEANEQVITLRYDSHDFPDVNFPFPFSAEASYRLEGQNFIMRICLTNEGDKPFPAGFGHHPYFVRQMENVPAQLEIPVDQEYEMVNKLTVAAPYLISQPLDFRQLRPLEPEKTGVEIDNVLTGANHSKPVRFVYGDVELHMTFDPIYGHVVFFSPLEKPFYAVEPVTNTNDGFNLDAQGVPGTGVFVLEPGQTQCGDIVLRVVKA